MTLEEAQALPYLTYVRETTHDLTGVFERVCDNGWEMQVSHQYDGGGFDFWPIATVEVHPDVVND